MLPVLMLVAALFSAAGPAMASHTSDHATEEISGVVAQAEQDMDDVVADFQHDLAGIETENQVGSAESAADAAIQTVWTGARDAVNDLVRLFPSVLGSVGAAANQQLQAARHTYQDLITALAEGWMPPEALVTTTTAFMTTTPPPPDPGNGSGGPPPDTGNGPGGPPPPNTGNGSDGSPNGPPGAPEDAEPNQSNPLDPNLPAGNDPVNSPSPSQASQRSSPAGDLEAPNGPTGLLSLAQTPGQPPALEQGAVGSEVGSKAAGATERVAALIETVLPPAVVDLVLSPLLVLEILVRTIWEGGLTIVGPLSLLAICALAILLQDRRSKVRRLAG